MRLVCARPNADRLRRSLVVALATTTVLTVRSCTAVLRSVLVVAALHCCGAARDINHAWYKYITTSFRLFRGSRCRLRQSLLMPRRSCAGARSATLLSALDCLHPSPAVVCSLARSIAPSLARGSAYIFTAITINEPSIYTQALINKQNKIGFLNASAQ